MPRPSNAREWLEALWPRLQDQRTHAEKYDAYYRGDQILEIVKRDYAQVFGGLLSPTKTNLCKIAVEALNERLLIDGFAVDDPDISDQVADAADDVWRRSQLDENAPVMHVESSVKAVSFGLAWPDPATGEVTISAEDAEQMAVAREQTPPYRVLAAVKTWRDDWGSGDFAEVYLSDGVYRFHKPSASALVAETGLTMPRGTMLRVQEWQPAMFDGGAERLPNPFDKTVPVVEFPNQPRLLTDPTSDLVDVAPLQDSFNKLLADLMIAASFGAVPLRYATGVALRTNKQGQPVDEQGNVVDPFAIRADRMFVSPDASSKFGTLPPATLEGFIAALGAIQRDFRAMTRVPWHYLDLGGSSGVSGEMLKALEGPLVRRVESVARRRGASWSRLIRLALSLEMSDVPPIRTMWAATETKSESTLYDGAQKLIASGVPIDMVMEEAVGWPQDLIRKLLRRIEEDQLNADALLTALQRDAVTAQPATTVPAEPADAGAAEQ